MTFDIVILTPIFICNFKAYDIMTIASVAHKNGLYNTAVEFYAILVELMTKKRHAAISNYCHIGKFSMSLSKSKHLLQSAKTNHDNMLFTQGPISTRHVCNLSPYQNNSISKFRFDAIMKHSGADVDLVRKSDMLCKGQQVLVSCVV